MPRTTVANNLEHRLATLASRFAGEVVGLLKTMSLADLTSVMGRAVGPSTPAATGNGRRTAAGRRWPTCSEKGCTGRYYPASGTAHLCYQHFLASGGTHPSTRKGRKRA